MHESENSLYRQKDILLKTNRHRRTCEELFSFYLIRFGYINCVLLIFFCLKVMRVTI